MLDGGLDVQKDSESIDAGFAFSPGKTDLQLFESWPQRTVDSQDLTGILNSWTLRIDGLTRNSITLRYSDLLSLPRHDQETDFHCVEGWSVYDVPWNGVHLSKIFELANPLPTASHITLYSVGDTYTESVPIEVALEPKTLLAYGVGGSTIPLAHGFPLRLVIPRLLAYKNAKYIYRIELTDKPIEGYWVRRGYAYDGKVPQERLREGKY